MIEPNPMGLTPDNLDEKLNTLSPELARMRKNYFNSGPELCIERAVLVTRLSKSLGILDKMEDKEALTILDKARLFAKILEEREPVVWHDRAMQKVARDGSSHHEWQQSNINDRNIFAGSTTTKYKGVPIYPEFSGLSIWPELAGSPPAISQRSKNPFYLAKEDARALAKTYPSWMNLTVTELARPECIEEMELFERLVFFLCSKTICITHTIPDFATTLKLGFNGIKERAQAKGQVKGLTDDHYKLCEAIEIVIDGIIAYTSNLSKQAKRLAAGNRCSSEDKERLFSIAQTYDNITKKPPETFREALSVIWLCWIALHVENPNIAISLGRLDQLLEPYYKKEVIQNKTMTREQAVNDICQFWLKIGDHVPMMPQAAEQLFGGSGSNQAVTIGGIKAKLNSDQPVDAVNDMTYVILDATELMRLRDPNLNARYFKGVNNKNYLHRLCEVNLSTRATPAIHNDEAVITALETSMKREHKANTGGTDITDEENSLINEHARDYGIIGCVEPVSVGRSYTASGAVLLNLPSALELTLFNGKHRSTNFGKQVSSETGNPATGDFPDFDSFKTAFIEQLEFMADKAVTLNNTLGHTHQNYCPTPIFSALFDGPIEKGKDVINGGALYNASGVTIIGLADVIDSLAAIKKWIYEEERFTFQDLLNAMKANFKDNMTAKEIGVLLRNPEKTPKFGKSDDANEIAIEIIRLLDNTFTNKRNYRNGNYRVGYWSMTNHAGFGRLMQAMPNGRYDKENFASGLTPVSQQVNDVTEALNAVAGLPPEKLSNGVAVNLKFSEPDIAGRKQMLDVLTGLINGYCEKGGHEIQFNIADYKTLEAATENSNFLVRVSGYTAYFGDLNKQMQKEIITRSEYNTITGKIVKLPQDTFNGIQSGGE